MTRRAFVTGGTGLLGVNLVRELIVQGFEVKVLARSPEKAERLLNDLPVQVVHGDLGDTSTFAHELEHCTALFLCGAFFREYTGETDQWPVLERVNVQASLELLDAADAAGIESAVYVSSSGALGVPAQGRLVDESTPYTRDRSNLYYRSKILAEERILDWQKSHELRVSLVLPGWIFGPYDEAVTASGQLVLGYIMRKLPFVLPGGLTVVDARDVAKAMINAAQKAKPGERYILGGQPTPFHEIIRILREVTGVPGPSLRVPYWAALLLAQMLRIKARLRNTPTLITNKQLRSLQHGQRYPLSSAKAQAELGARFRPLRETLQDEVEWYRTRGFF